MRGSTKYSNSPGRNDCEVGPATIDSAVASIFKTIPFVPRKLANLAATARSEVHAIPNTPSSYLDFDCPRNKTVASPSNGGICSLRASINRGRSFLSHRGMLHKPKVFQKESNASAAVGLRAVLRPN